MTSRCPRGGVAGGAEKLPLVGISASYAYSVGSMCLQFVFEVVRLCRAALLFGLQLVFPPWLDASWGCPVPCPWGRAMRVVVAVHVGSVLTPPLDLPHGRAMLSRRLHCQGSFQRLRPLWLRCRLLNPASARVALARHLWPRGRPLPDARGSRPSPALNSAIAVIPGRRPRQAFRPVTTCTR